MIGDSLQPLVLATAAGMVGAPPTGSKITEVERGRLLACVSTMRGADLTGDDWTMDRMRLEIRDFLTRRGLSTDDIADTFTAKRGVPMAVVNALATHPNLKEMA